jgi:DNA invertase Pin-like site-specific DNA recombinase
VSTLEQGTSGLGLDAQREQINGYVARQGWELVGEFEDTISGKVLHRPALDEALTTIEAGMADGLVVAKLDRLSRSLLHFVELLERSRKKGWTLIALDLGIDTSTPSGEMVANVLMSFAQFERRLIGQRTKDALAIKKARGTRLGRPTTVTPAMLDKLTALALQGLSLRAIAKDLNENNVPTLHGGALWHASTVRSILQATATRSTG